MDITRRDFLNGVAITLAASMTPLQLLQAAPDGVAQVDDEDRHALGFPACAPEGCRPREQDHEVRMLHA